MAFRAENGFCFGDRSFSAYWRSAIYVCFLGILPTNKTGSDSCLDPGKTVCHRSRTSSKFEARKYFVFHPSMTISSKKQSSYRGKRGGNHFLPQLGSTPSKTLQTCNYGKQNIQLHNLVSCKKEEREDSCPFIVPIVTCYVSFQYFSLGLFITCYVVDQRALLHSLYMYRTYT